MRKHVIFPLISLLFTLCTQILHDTNNCRSYTLIVADSCYKSIASFLSGFRDGVEFWLTKRFLCRFMP